MSQPSSSAFAATGVSQHQSSSAFAATGVSQHQSSSPVAETNVSQQSTPTPNADPAFIDLSEEDDFLKDDIVIEWLFVDWQKQIKRAENTRVEVKKRIEILARSIATGGWKPVDRFLCFLPATEQCDEIMEILICLAGQHVSKKYDFKKGIDRTEELAKFDPVLVERVSLQPRKYSFYFHIS